MVQGLAFLSKKSWHTKNLANQEKVWMAEQRKAAEESKTKELAKQIQQEREQEELDKIAGRKNVRRDRGIDWMYQGGAAIAKEEEERKNEEYLLGKELQPEGKAAGDFADLETGGVNDVIAKKPAASEDQVPASAAAPSVNAEPSVADRNEAFRMRHEDPMFLVSQTQRQKQTQQDKKRALYERVVGPTEDKKPQDESERRRPKKERKRERKQHRRDEEERSRDRHHRDRHRRSRSPRSRSSSRERDRKKRHKRSHRSRSPGEDRRRSRSRDRYHHDDNRRYESRRRERSPNHESDRRRYRSRSPAPRDGYRRLGSPNGGYHGRGEDRYERRLHHDRGSSPPRHYEKDRGREPESERARSEGYGLQGGKSSASRHDDLGPNRELLERKRQERDSERRRFRERASNRRRMTQEERAAALQAMERDASKRDELLSRAVAAKSRHDQDDQDSPASGKATFLQDMAERTHGIREGGSLASRVAQNRHTNQKLSDSFL